MSPARLRRVNTAAAPTEHGSLIGVERAVRVLQSLAQVESTNLADLARATDLSEATVLRYLNSLTTLGFVERSESARYRLGWEVFRLGQRALAGHVPRQAVRPVMEQLLAEFNETVNFAYRKGDEVVIVEVFEGTRALKKVSDVGQSDPWHASALGKALLSTMDDDEWKRLLERVGMPRLTSNTILSIAKMAAELKETRSRGYAIDREEFDEGLSCVASVVPTPAGMAQFVLSVSFLSHRLEPGGLEKAGVRIVEATAEIGRRLHQRTQTFGP
jgi:DNA-binding IclR family transcriptional regulator